MLDDQEGLLFKDHQDYQEMVVLDHHLYQEGLEVQAECLHQSVQEVRDLFLHQDLILRMIVIVRH